jgi:HEAT repeat protein
VAGLALGALLAFAVNGRMQAVWDEVSQILSLRRTSDLASPAILSERGLIELDRQRPQKQAEVLLDRAIHRYDGANDQIARRVDSWRGKLKLTSQLNSLVAAGLNSNDLRVRAMAIEVDLAAGNTAKTPESVDRLIEQATSGDQPGRVWALWTLGLLGNRGVEAERIGQFLITQVKDPTPEIRHWVVDALACLGTDEAIPPLLEVLHDDPSPMVREEAACGLAQAGMFNESQRRGIIPTLLDFADDRTLDTQTHQWVYHALRDITAQNLPDDPAAWRNWYDGSSAGMQNTN